MVFKSQKHAWNGYTAYNTRINDFIRSHVEKSEPLKDLYETDDWEEFLKQEINEMTEKYNTNLAGRKIDPTPLPDDEE